MATAEKQARENLKALAENPYPGRGIVMGRTAVGDLLQIYWVMGRSENSRNRILENIGGTIMTAPFDATKMKDPRLVIYSAMRSIGNYHIVSNGDQTDAVVDGLQKGSPVDEILSRWSYEPDEPHYTPRITGILNTSRQSYQLWLTRRDERTGLPEHFYNLPDKFAADALGLCIHTYRSDGEPLPSFDGAPYDVPLGEGASDSAEIFWQNLNPDNRVAIVTKQVDGQTGEVDFHIINTHQR